MFASPGPVLYDLGELLGLQWSLPLRWYGVLIGLGLVAAYLLVHSHPAIKAYFDKEEKNSLFIDWVTWTFLGGIIGARLWFVILNAPYYLNNLQESFFIWEGGQSIQGGIVGGVVASLIFRKIYKQHLPSWLWTADKAVAGLALGQAIGRWGNFFNSEAFGKPTDLPWGFYVPLADRPIEYAEYELFQPTFAYESIFLVILSFALYRVSLLKDIPEGLNFCLYLFVYSLGRFFLEFQRTDSLMIGYFPAAQVICSLSMLLSLVMAVVLFRQSAHPIKQAIEKYE